MDRHGSKQRETRPNENTLRNLNRLFFWRFFLETMKQRKNRLFKQKNFRVYFFTTIDTKQTLQQRALYLPSSNNWLKRRQKNFPESKTMEHYQVQEFNDSIVKSSAHNPKIYDVKSFNLKVPASELSTWN